MPVVSETAVTGQYERLPEIKHGDIQRIRDWLSEQPHLPTLYITVQAKMPVVSETAVTGQYERLPEIKHGDIQRIRDWLSEQPHLPTLYITDDDIKLAYHCCGCILDMTEKVMELNYTLRTFFSFYQNRKVDDSLRAALRTWLITPLKIPTKKGYQAIFCQLLDADPNRFVYADVVRAFVMIIDLWLHEEGAAAGTVFLVDMDRVSLGHLSRIDLTVAQQFFYFLQEAMFIRLKEFHFINAPSFIDALLSMVRPFMKKELLDMLFIHSVGATTLEEYIPLSALPSESDRCGDKNWDKLKANEKFFEQEAKLRTNEAKRPGPGGPKTMSSFFAGLETSFKKLEID